MLKNIVVAHFSPTGGTKRASLYLAKGIAQKISEIDLSLTEESKYTFENSDVVIFAVPAFGGRIPEFVVRKIKSFQGNQATAITVIVYGNRAYDDALTELNDSVKLQGFVVSGSVALLAEHSMSRDVAKGRPDAQDEAEIKSFAQSILEKLTGNTKDVEPSVPGNHPYKEWKPMPAVPVVSDDCNKCGLCAEKCPTQAISKENLQATDASKCILCMRCVSICPQQARALPTQVQGMLDQKLAPLQGIRHNNELFI